MTVTDNPAPLLYQPLVSSSLRGKDHPLLTVAETAAAFRVSRETIRRMAHARRMGAIILGSGAQAQIRVPRALVERMLADAASGQTVVAAEYTEAWRNEKPEAEVA